MNPSQFTYYKLITNKYAVFMLIGVLSITLKLNAQTISSPKIKDDVKIESDHQNKNVHIEFGTNKEIYNLLVLITDSLGQTVFLDNRYHFKGNYKHSVNFKEFKKGRYSVQIIGDNQKINKKIDVK